MESEIAPMSPNRIMRPLARDYVRDATLVRQLNDLLAMPDRLFWNQVEKPDPKTGEPWKLEALVTMIRMFKEEDNIAASWKLIIMIRDRISNLMAQSLKRWVRIEGTHREEVIEETLERMCEILLRTDDDAMFWEVNFVVCIRRLIANQAKKADLYLSRQIIWQDEQEIYEVYETISDNSPSAEMIIDMQLAEEVLQTLPDHLERVFRLTYYRQWTEQQIAESMNVTTRTVRNYKKRAEDLIKEWRKSQEL